MAIPIVNGKIKIYRADPDGHGLHQVYPEIDPDTGDTSLTVLADNQPLKATETVLLLPASVSTGAEEPGNQSFVKIYADWGNPEFYLPQVDDLIFYEDTSSDARRKTGRYKQVNAEDPHTGTSAAHVRLVCIREKEPFAGFTAEPKPFVLED